jgi:copper chaperone CopZ
MSYIVIKVNGMKCVHCAHHVQHALEGLPTVRNVTIDLAKGTASFEADIAPQEADLKKAIEEAGYEYAGLVK